MSLRTIQVNIDESLLAEVEQALKLLDISRSAFIRNALQLAMKQHKNLLMERKHQEGYANKPVEQGEFDVWEPEQEWQKE